MVAALLGHDSVETTANYSHPSARDLDALLDRSGRFTITGS
jgi:site-specific recombinase XerD